MTADYGTQQEVAAMASMWTRDGLWVDPATTPVVVIGTNPTLTQVESWLDSISAQMNLALENRGFVVPIVVGTSPNAYKSCSQYVVSLVADLCHFKNSSGRFFTEKLVERGVTPMNAILKDMVAWVEMNEPGMIADHVPQVIVPVKKRYPAFRLMGDFPSSNPT